MPCCMSTTRESQPAWAITSAEKLLGMPHQLLITGFPAAQLSRTRLARAIRSSSCSAQTRPIPPAGAGEVKDLPGISLGVPGYGSRFRSTNSRLGISKFAVCQAQEFGCRPLIRLHAGIELVDRALDLNPSFARGWQQSAWLRMLAGEPDPANMPHQLCLASLTVSSADGYAPSCASRKSAPALDDAKPTINAGPMSSSRLTGSSPRTAYEQARHSR